MSPRALSAVAVLLLAGCAAEAVLPSFDAPGDAVMGDGGRFAAAGQVDPRWRATTICPDGAVTPGVDVSYWQGSIDWARLSGDVDFAFIRVSDGLAYPDSRFAGNWAGARSSGVVRGAYQFFRPSVDAVAQADLLLSTMGPLEPGDLPPVIDVEVSDGQSAATINAGIADWLDRVEGELGVEPIIYTSWGLWSSLTGDTAQFADVPLWVANWGVACPSVPSAWTSWAFWQHSDNGAVAGIAGAVDENWFNGDLAALEAFADVEPVCGDGVCSGDETHDVCPDDCPICEPIPPEGATVEETDVCFTGGGNPQYLYVVAAGSGGSLLYTHTTDAAVVDNYGEWALTFDAAGDYLVEAYTAAPHAESTRAAYQVAHAFGTDVIVVDQTAIDGWSPIGVFTFDEGPGASVRLDDNTGEPYAGGETQIVFDAIRLTPLAVDPTSPTTAGTAGTAGTTGDPSAPATTAEPQVDAAPSAYDREDIAPGCGCAASGSPATVGAALLALAAGLIGARRGRPSGPAQRDGDRGGEARVRHQEGAVRGDRAAPGGSRHV